MIERKPCVHCADPPSHWNICQHYGLPLFAINIFARLLGGYANIYLALFSWASLTENRVVISRFRTP